MTGRAAAIGASVLLFALGAWLLAVSGEPVPEHRLVAIAVSRSGRWLAAGTASGSITLWDLKRQAVSRRLSARQGSLNDLQFTPDERHLGVANEQLRLYSLEEKLTADLVLRADERNYGTLRFSSDGRSALTITGDGRIEMLRANGSAQVVICCSTIYGEVAFSPDNRFLLNAGHWPTLWDASTGRLVRRLTEERQTSTFRPIAFDPASDTVLMGSQDGRVYRWDLNTGTLLARSRASQGYVDTILVLRNDWVVYAGYGTPISMWHLPTGEQRRLDGARPTSNLAIHADGVSVAFGTAAGQVEVWDVVRGERSQALLLSGR